MVIDYFTAKDVAKILNIDEISAKEMLDGVIEFEAAEVYLLAQAAGISVDEILKK